MAIVLKRKLVRSYRELIACPLVLVKQSSGKIVDGPWNVLSLGYDEIEAYLSLDMPTVDSMISFKVAEYESLIHEWQEVYDWCLGKLGIQLSAIHGIHFGKREWEIVFGNWLWRTTGIALNRYNSLMHAVNHLGIEKVVISDSSYNTPRDPYCFVNELDHRLDGALYKSIRSAGFVKGLHNVTIEEVADSTPRRGEKFRRSRTKTLAKTILDECRLVSSRQGKPVITQTYLTSWKEKRLLELCCGNRFAFSYESSRRPIDSELRRCLGLRLLEDADCELKKVVACLIEICLPKSFLEEFREIYKRACIWANRLRPCSAYTSNSYDFNVFYSVFTAECKRAHGTRLIVGQHGNHYGTKRGYLYPEERVSDVFIGWGARTTINTSSYGVVTYDERLAVEQSDCGRVILVTTTAPLRTHIMNDWNDFFNRHRMTHDFITAWPKSGSDELCLRLYKSHARLTGYFTHSYTLREGIEINYGTGSFWGLIQESSIVVFSYYSTGFLELIARGFPCIGLWDKVHEMVNDNELNSDLAKLEGLGIIHRDSAKAVQFICRLKETGVQAWWDKVSSSDTLLKFSEKYCKRQSGVDVYLTEL